MLSLRETSGMHLLLYCPEDMRGLTHPYLKIAFLGIGKTFLFPKTIFLTAPFGSQCSKTIIFTFSSLDSPDNVLLLRIPEYQALLVFAIFLISCIVIYVSLKKYNK